jgi:hypothetical protein
MADIFISYVAQDKDFVSVLIQALRENGIDVIDGKLKLGDSFSKNVLEGVKSADYVMLILSSSFFAKSWPRYEFEEVDKIDRDFEAKTKLLPVWHEIDRQSVAYYAPELAQRLGVPSDIGIGNLVSEILEVVKSPETISSTFQTQANASPMAKSISETPISRSQLRDNLVNFFSEGELRSLCFDLGIDYEELGGRSKNVKVLELIGYMQRRARMDELMFQAKKLRPDASW